MKKFGSDLLAQLLVMLIVSAIGGGVGMYVGYQLVLSRVDRLERDVAAQEIKLDGVTRDMSQIRVDVSWIRGRLTSTTDTTGR